jgi:hypothetical protein
MEERPKIEASREVNNQEDMAKKWSLPHWIPLPFEAVS